MKNFLMMIRGTAVWPMTSVLSLGFQSSHILSKILLLNSSTQSQMALQILIFGSGLGLELAVVELGDSNFGKAYFATSKDELTPAGYQIHKRSQESASTMTIESNSDENQGLMLTIVDCAVVRLTDEVRVRTSLSNTITTTTTTTDDDDDDDNSSTSDNTTSNETVTQPSTASSISSFCQNIATHSTSSNLTRIVIRPINLTQELNSSTISLTYTTDSVIINQLTRSTGSRSNQSSPPTQTLILSASNSTFSPNLLGTDPGLPLLPRSPLTIANFSESLIIFPSIIPLQQQSDSLAHPSSSAGNQSNNQEPTLAQAEWTVKPSLGRRIARHLLLSRKASKIFGHSPDPAPPPILSSPLDTSLLPKLRVVTTITSHNQSHLITSPLPLTDHHSPEPSITQYSAEQFDGVFDRKISPPYQDPLRSSSSPSPSILSGPTTA
ncbi:hypothetical protein BY996DRAFT_6420463 [Phakopsora pachyrhizi]|nr:hypothetical protein BY996DRAFT_6420463 [Phakopsora pachyrhizi]